MATLSSIVALIGLMATTPAFAAAKSKPVAAAKAPAVKGSEKFLATCTELLKASKKEAAAPTCACIVRGLGDNDIKPAEFDLLEQNYRKPLDLTKAQKEHPELEVTATVDLEFQIATECVKNPNFKVKRN